LRCQKTRRKHHGGRDWRVTLPNQISIEQRPAIVDTRRRTDALNIPPTQPVNQECTSNLRSRELNSLQNMIKSILARFVIPSKLILNRLKSRLDLSLENPELLVAQCAALSRMIPILYLLLLADAWMLVFAFAGRAPAYLTTHIALLLSALCIVRFVMWLRMQRVQITAERARRELKRTAVLTIILSISFISWALALFPYGDAAGHASVFVFITIAMIGSMIFLWPLRAAAIGETICSVPIFMGYFVVNGHPSFIALTLNVSVVALALLVVVMAQNRQFVHLVTAQIKARDREARIHQLAHYDTLTGLANRNTFREKMAASLDDSDGHLALLFLDLDGFKIVNDTKGHHFGDLVLKQVAHRMRQVCNEPGIVIGRVGGDEFTILLPKRGVDEASAVALRLIDTLAETYRLDDDRWVRIGASVGIAVAPLQGKDVETLLTCADLALYTAKAAGKGVFKVFEPQMETCVQERIRIEAELRDALDAEDGLFVFYQDIVDVRTGEITTREALVRWHHPKRGWISPGEFISVAEESGLIDRLGLFVLSRACRHATEWRDGARVAVNVSAAQLGKGTLASDVLATLVDTGLSPRRLEIEVTETVLLNNEQDTLDDLRQLQAMGVRVALDDFGTGYSSLSHLRAFTFDKIKIDRSFVRHAVDRPDCAAIVRVVAALGERLGIATVAEGVETQAQLDRVRREGCHEIQGYLFSRPMPSEHDAPIVAALNASTRRRAA